MRSVVTLAVVIALAAPAAPADDSAPPAPPVAPKRAKPLEPRKFEGGKLTDPYWGVTYALPGLEEKKVERLTGKLFDGKAGRVQVEIGIWEFADELSATQRRDADRQKWEAKRRAMAGFAQGDDPAPWVTFEEEAPSGGMRRHGYAWYVRGCRAFVVHSYVMADAEGGAEGVKSALAGLTVGPETGAAVFVQMVSRQKEMPHDDPGVLDGAAQHYLAEDPGTTPRPAIAEELLARAVANLPGSPLARSAPGVLHLHENLAVAQMKLKKYDASIATLTGCLALAEKTDRPGPDGAGIQYNLACAYSLAGRTDDAFLALDKAFAKWPPVDDEHLKKDADLDNCRRDARWSKFLETKPTRK